MLPYGMEEVLRYYRVKKNLTQKQVYEGICEKAAYLRLEGELREYDYLLWETFLSRLGKSAARFEFILDEEDADLHDLRYSIRLDETTENWGRLAQSLKKYQDKCPKDQTLHKLHRQFVLYYQAVLLEQDGGEAEKTVALLQEALSLTRPDFAEQPIGASLFSAMEVRILYHLFLHGAYARSSMDALMQFVDRFYDDEEKEPLMVPFLYQRAKEYDAAGKPYEMGRVAEKAIEIIRAGRSYTHLNDFCFMKLRAAVQTAWQGDRDQKKEEWQKECHNLYYMYLLEGETEKMEAVRTYAKEVLQCPFTVLEPSCG